MGKVKFAVFVFFVILGFTIGLSLGFYLGMVSLVTVFDDVTDEMNTTIIIDFNEETAIDYLMTYLEMTGELEGLLEEAKTHPEQRNISQTVQNFKGFEQ